MIGKQSFMKSLFSSASKFPTPLAIKTAIANNDNETLIRFIKSGTAFLSMRFGRHNVSIAHLAVENNNLKALQLYGDNGGDLNAKDDYLYRTPVMLAAKSGKVTSIEYLIKKGADVNALDKDGNNSLILAFSAKRKDSKIYSAFNLMKTKVNLNHQNRSGQSIAHYAATLKNAPIITIMKESHVNFNIQDIDGLTPLMYGLSRGLVSANVARTIALKDCNLAIKDNYGRTALDIALEGQHHSCAIELIKAGAQLSDCKSANFEKAVLIYPKSEKSALVRIGNASYLYECGKNGVDQRLNVGLSDAQINRIYPGINIIELSPNTDKSDISTFLIGKLQ